MSESGEDARLQRFIERERMGLTDEAKARIRELERVVAEKDARIEALEAELDRVQDVADQLAAALSVIDEGKEA